MSPKRKKQLPMSPLIKIPYIPKNNEQDDFEKPKFISLEKYNNYKYQSLYLNYILKDKEIFNDKFTKEYVNSLKYIL